MIATVPFNRSLFVSLLFILSLSGLKAQDNNIFTVARTNDTLRAAQILLKDPSAVNSTDERGYTPLILAAYNGKALMTKYFLKHGAKVNYETSQGTALHSVAFKGNAEITKILIEAGVNVNHVSSEGTTALIYATMFNHIELVKLLVKAGANPEIKDAEGKTAVDYANLLKQEEILKLLKKDKK